MLDKKKVLSRDILYFKGMKKRFNRDDIRIAILTFLNEMFKKIDDDNIEASQIELTLYSKQVLSEIPMAPNWFDRLKRDGFYDKRNRGIRGAST